MYDRLNVQFLIDPEDTLAVYEQRAAASKSCEEEGEDELVKALVDNVDHNVAVEMIHGSCCFTFYASQYATYMM